jgi:hypothetical protein
LTTPETTPPPATPTHVPKKVVAGAAAILVATAVGSALVSHNLIYSGAASKPELTAFRQLNKPEPVPFLGPFAWKKKGVQECGPAVRLMEGALRNTRPPVRRTRASNCVGRAATSQIKRFQARHHIPQSGIYGHRTHAALAPRYTRRQVRDLRYLQLLRLDKLRRDTILVVTSHAYQLRSTMGYCNNGSLSNCSLRGVWPPWADVPHHTDCSGYVSWVLYQSGVPNPNGSGVGNTTSLVQHGIPVSARAPLHIGDLVFYGSNTHVAIYIGHGLVSSHGRPGLDIHPFGYRPIYAIRRYF